MTNITIYHKKTDTLAELIDKKHNDLTDFQGGAIGEYYHLTNAQYAELHDKDKLTSGTGRTFTLTDEGAGQLLSGSVGDLRINGVGRTDLGDLAPTGGIFDMIGKGRFYSTLNIASYPAWAAITNNPIGTASHSFVAVTRGIMNWTMGDYGLPLVAMRMGSGAGLLNNVGHLFACQYASDDLGVLQTPFIVSTNDAGNSDFAVASFAGSMTAGTVYKSYNNATVAAYTATNSTAVCTNVNADLLDGLHASAFAELADNINMTGGAGKWFRPPQMTTTERNTMTTGWGVADAGKEWYNTTTNQWEGWDGTAIVIIG